MRHCTVAPRGPFRTTPGLDLSCTHTRYLPYTVGPCRILHERGVAVGVQQEVSTARWVRERGARNVRALGGIEDQAGWLCRAHVVHRSTESRRRCLDEPEGQMELQPVELLVVGQDEMASQLEERSPTAWGYNGGVGGQV